MCMQLVQKPELYDVLVLPEPLRRHRLRPRRRAWSAASASRPGANFGTRGGGVRAHPRLGAASTPGQNKVNPIAMMLSGVLMLRHLGERDAADRLEARDRGGDRRGHGSSPTT